MYYMESVFLKLFKERNESKLSDDKEKYEIHY